MADVYKRYGILGGTFNPIHNGHIELASAAINQYGLSKVLVMPNNKPAYKSTKELCSNKQRADMVKLAIENIDGLEFSDVELNRAGDTYTYETLEYLCEKMPDVKWYFIIGGDSIMYFDKWRYPEKIVSMAAIIVAVRGDVDKYTVMKKISELKELFPFAEFLYEETDPVDISSSKLREMIGKGEDVSDYLNSSVALYIKNNGLYKD